MRTSRTLIAFAYVADQFAKTNDLVSGLLPLFAPLISSRAGDIFDPVNFCADIKKTYDLDMHPYVAEELAPSLAKSGFLTIKEYGINGVQYINASFSIPEAPISEAQAQNLVDDFCAFGIDHLQKAGLSATADELQAALLDRLTRPGFMELVLRPDNVDLESTTLSLPRQADISDDLEDRYQQRLDYLVSKYILNLAAKSESAFELLLSVTTGCLVSEVVLDLKDPPSRGDSLAGLKIALDSPLILDALGLGQDGATEYSKQLIAQIKSIGATPVVFDYTIEEIQRALRSTLQHFERGQDLYGPLGKKLLKGGAFPAYLRTVIPKIAEDVSKLQVELLPVTKFERARRLSVFTEPSELELSKSIGDYSTDDARTHDARAIADVLRLRDTRDIKSIKDCQVLFVTRNSRLSRLSKRFLADNSFISRDYFPPCITDRYLAGILWIIVGGGTATLSRLRLIANCSIGTLPRKEIVARMHKFFKTLKPDMVERFEALMTNERAEHFLMERTIYDKTLVTAENFEEIYREVEEVAAVRVTEKKDKEISKLKDEHSKQIETITQRHESVLDEHKNKYIDETAKNLELRNSLNDAVTRESELSEERTRLANRLQATDQKLANACLRNGRNAVILVWFVLIIFLAALSTIVSMLSANTRVNPWVTGAAVFLLAVLTPIIGNTYWKDNPFEKYLDRRWKKAIINRAKLIDADHVIERYVFNRETNTALPINNNNPLVENYSKSPTNN